MHAPYCQRGESSIATRIEPPNFFGAHHFEIVEVDYCDSFFEDHVFRISMDISGIILELLDASGQHFPHGGWDGPKV